MKSKNLIEESIKLQLEAKAIGLDWIELDKIIDKIREETDELDEAIESKDREHVIEEFGDLFFSIISLSRHLNINMDDLINSANQKFKDRLSKINVEMKKRNIEYAEPAEMIEIWKSIKKQND
jgi:ATP diphosphatase|tara:strand:+ start:139 stop:507 length:369 start_codon:yes stop_codon:yes gene_type:complete